MEVTWDAGSGLTQLMQPERSPWAVAHLSLDPRRGPCRAVSPWFSWLAGEQHVCVGRVWLLGWPRKEAPRCSRAEKKAFVADPGPGSEGAAYRVPRSSHVDICSMVDKVIALKTLDSKTLRCLVKIIPKKTLNHMLS